MRVNARLDDSYAEKLDFLQSATHQSVSDIVRHSVDRYYEAVLAEQKRKRTSLDKLVGAFSGGPRDGSSRYKQDIADYVDAKHANTPEPRNP